LGRKDLKQKLSELDSNKLLSWIAWIFSFAVGAMALVFWLYFSNFHGEFSPKHEVWGAFGDFVGGTLNTILSFLALIALLLTIILQNRELEATREELRRSAEAQESSQQSMKDQSDILVRQQFEQTFFSLLEQHNAALNRMSIATGKWTNGMSDLDKVRSQVLKEDSLIQAKAVLETHNGLCGHYFRILYQLLKFISTNIPDGKIGPEFDKDKIVLVELAKNEKMYSNMVRSFLSYDVSQLLAINCYCEDENNTYWRYKQLLERYEFLEHMPFKVDQKQNELLLSTRCFYHKAFGQSGFVASL